MEECPICYGVLIDDDIIKLECTHNYHKSCILEWFCKNNMASCPLCRRPANINGYPLQLDDILIKLVTFYYIIPLNCDDIIELLRNTTHIITQSDKLDNTLIPHHLQTLVTKGVLDKMKYGYKLGTTTMFKVQDIH